MDKPPAFQLYAADFYMDTVTWDTDDIGAYFRLLMWSWVNGPLPCDLRKLSKIAGKTNQKFKKNWSEISQKFSSDGNGNFINERLERTRTKQCKYLELQKKHGKIGADKRWKHLSDPNGDPIATLSKKNSPSSSSSSSTSVKDKKTNKKSGNGLRLIPSDFCITKLMRVWFKTQEFKNIEIEAQTDEFVDYWLGAGKMKKDWIATWRNSMRKMNEWKSNDKIAEDAWKNF